MRVTFHHLCHILLVTSKSQVLVYLRGQDYTQRTDPQKVGMMGTTLGSVLVRYKNSFWIASAQLNAKHFSKFLLNYVIDLKIYP